MKDLFLLLIPTSLQPQIFVCIRKTRIYVTCDRKNDYEVLASLFLYNLTTFPNADLPKNELKCSLINPIHCEIVKSIYKIKRKCKLII